MNSGQLNDTIAAVATAAGEAGIGIVRLSGKEALAIADKIFVSPSGGKPSAFKTYTTHYGLIAGGPDPQNNVIDEVILTVMRRPRSYTKEDVVEVNCHGGLAATRAVLDLVLACGARLAEPGEFTKRAFLNGRIDLTQAEAVLDVIRAKTDSALRAGLRQMEGGVSRRLNKLRTGLLKMLAALEAEIDFPEEEGVSAEREPIYKRLSAIRAEISSLIESSKYAQMLRQGLHLVICGRPNVGKSSLLNTLLKQERSIVTPIPGTTRDTVEEIIEIKGIPVRVVDTAGILKPRGLIEKKALERSKRYIQLADIVLLLFDASQPLQRGDELLMKKLPKKRVIAVINKIDLKRRGLRQDKIRHRFARVVEISAKKATNINLLEEAVCECVYGGAAGGFEAAAGNSRQSACLSQAQKLIAESLRSLDNKIPAEFVAQGIKDALLQFDLVLGKEAPAELLDKIFSSFCIGK